MTTAIMACMRNEAMFVTEWVAYHRLIGFDKVFVCTNGCNDGTDTILDRLAVMGQVIHLRNDDMGGLPPQPAGVKKVLNHPAIRDVDWLLHIDADEFLNIHHGDGHVRHLVEIGRESDAIAMTWRLFGNAGMQDWTGGLLIEQQRLAEAHQSVFGAMQKTMFRPQRFAGGIDHMPKRPVAADVRLCSARGRTLNPAALHDHQSSDLRVAFGKEVNRKRHFGWDGAQINHYAVRTPDLFLMKNIRGDGIGSRFTKRYHLNSRWYRAANRNEVEDLSIQRHLPALAAAMAELRRDKGLKLLEKMAFKRFSEMKTEFLTADNINAWTNAASDSDAVA